MAGTVFLQAQYLQFVLQYTPLAAGFALVPAAIGMLLGTGAGAHLAEMHGGRIAVTIGTLIATAGVAVQAAFVDGGSYVPTGIGLLLFGLGAGIAMPAATEMIMATLPPARAGVGSAVNDTVREFGGALGVAVIGSVAATSYATSMHSELGRFPNLTAIDRSLLANNVGAAIHTSGHAGAQADGDRSRCPQRVRRLDAQFAVDRCGACVRRRCRDVHTAAPPGDTRRARWSRCARWSWCAWQPRCPHHRRTSCRSASARRSGRSHHVGRGVGVMNNIGGTVAGDVLVVGGGAAGLTAALVLARARHRVTVIDDQTHRNATVDEFHGFPTRDATTPNHFRGDALAELHSYGVTVIRSTVASAASTDRSVACS